LIGYGFLSLMVFFLFFFVGLRRVPLRQWGMHPFFWFSYHVFLHCPIRALLLGYGLQNPVFLVDEKDLALAVLYGTAFYVFTAVFCNLFHRCGENVLFRPCRIPLFLGRSSNQWLNYGLLLLIPVLLSYLYGIGTNSFSFIDGDTERQLSFSLAKMIAMNISSFVNYLFAIAFLFWQKEEKNKKNKIIVCLAFFLFCLRGVTSGSRGFILASFFILVSGLLLIGGVKKMLRGVLVVAVPIFFLLTAVTYFRSGEGENIYSQGTTTNWEAVRERIKRVKGEAKVENLEGSQEHILSRATYQLDAWAFLLSQPNSGEQKDRGRYLYGSIADFRHFIPKVVWEERDPEDFNYWLGTYLFQAPYMKLNFPVGRIGESFLIFGKEGLIFSVLNGFLFVWFFRKFFLSKIPFWAIAYIPFHISWSMQGQATFFWNMVNPIKNFLYFFLVTLVLLTLFFRKKGHLSGKREGK